MVNEDYNATTDEIRNCFVEGMIEAIPSESGITVEEAGVTMRDLFDRWLREELAKAWDAGAEEQYYMSEKVASSRLNPYREAAR